MYRKNLFSFEKADLTTMFSERGTVLRILAFKNNYLPTALHVAASEDDVEKLAALLQRKTMNRNVQNKLGDTAFHVAVPRQCQHCLKMKTLMLVYDAS